jgi:hypothetical protein
MPWMAYAVTDVVAAADTVPVGRGDPAGSAGSQ